MKQYVQTDLDADREVANTLADLIIGGLLTTDEIDGQGDEADHDEANRGRRRSQIRSQIQEKGPVPCSEPDLYLGSGGRI
jgi:hypothetical protein